MFSDITKTSFADLLDTSELKVLLQHLKNKHNTPKLKPERGISPLNRTNLNKNINVELKSIKYKIEIITKKPVTQKVVIENDSSSLPALSNVIKFWNMYMKSNEKDNIKYYSDDMTTIKVTPDPHHSIDSEAAETINKVFKGLLSNKDTKGTISDFISENQQKENHRFSNYKNNNGPHSDGKKNIFNDNDVPSNDNKVGLNKYVFKEVVNDTSKDFSLKGLLNNIYSFFSKPQKEDKLSSIEIDTPKSKPKKREDVYQRSPPEAANSIKDNKKKIGMNNESLNNKFSILKSLLANFQISKYKDKEDVLASMIKRLEQMGKDQACPPTSTLSLKGNSSMAHKVPPSHLTDLLYGIMNEPVTVPTLENMNSFEENTERYHELIQQYYASPEKNYILFEHNKEQAPKLAELLEPQPVKNDVYNAEHNTEVYPKFTPQHNVLTTLNKNYFEQKTEKYQKLYNVPLKYINYFEPITLEPQKFISQHEMPLDFGPVRNQTDIDDFVISGSQSFTPNKKEIVSTPVEPTERNYEKYLHPDIVKQIAESVKQLVLNEIQDRLLSITKPAITTEVATKEVTTEEYGTTTMPHIDTTINSLNNSPNDEMVMSTTAGMKFNVTEPTNI